jgi:heme/copper-type cytochrome/quinol oxidase subunit 2
MYIMLSIIFILIFLILIVALVRRSNDVIVYDDFDDGIETTTVTTTVTTNTPAVVATVGTIYAYQNAGNAQWFVKDPVDNEETAVNANDDYYRDAGGKVWSLM